ALARPRPHAIALRGQIIRMYLAGTGARLRHHDTRLALGGTGAAQSDPRPAGILRVQLLHPNGLRRPDLRDGGRAAAVCADLRLDSCAAGDAVRRGAGDGVGTIARSRAGREPPATQGDHPALADRDLSAGLPGDLARPGIHWIAPFPVRDPRP